MTREAIDECLKHHKNGENNIKFLTFCREPKTYSEVKNTRIKGDLFKRLVELKLNGALAFVDGKYFSTKQGLDALKSIG